MIEMTPIVKEKTPDNDRISELFSKITNEIIESGKGYDEVAPYVLPLFLETMKVFLDINQLINDNKQVDFSNQQIKMALFESTFGFDFDGTIENLIKSRMSATGFDDGSTSQSDEDINNADEDLLKNIKANIQDYLKD